MSIPHRLLDIVVKMKCYVCSNEIPDNEIKIADLKKWKICPEKFLDSLTPHMPFCF